MPAQSPAQCTIVKNVKECYTVREFVHITQKTFGGKYMDGFIDKFAQRKNAQEMIKANAMAEAEERERMASRLSEYEMALQEMRRCNLQTMENAEKVKELLAAGLHKIEEVQKKDAGMDRKPEELIGEMRNLSEELIGGMKNLSEELKGRMAELGEGQKDQKGRMEELGEGQKDQKGRMAELREGQEDQKGRMAELREGQEELKSRVAELGEGQEELKSRMAEELLHAQSELFEKQNARIQELMEAQKKTLEELLHATEDFNHREAVKVYRNVQAVIDSALPKQTEAVTEAVEGKGTPVGLKIMWATILIAALANLAIEVLKFL